jgi:FG-GAP-like repeat
MLRKLVLGLIVLTFAVAASAQAQSLFVTPPIVAPGGVPTSGAGLGDLNGDGRLDVVYPDGSVLLAKADGTYQTGTPWCTSGQPYCGTLAIQSVVVADFNQDGKQDLAVATSNFVWVLLGKGDGTFQAAVSSVSGTTTTALIVADVNGDAKLDALLVPPQSGTISICLGNGDGTFQPATAGPTMTNLLFVGVADLNGDHKVDLLARTAAQFSVFTGNGDGTFSNTPIVTNLTLPVGGNSNFDFQLVDLDGDGKADIVASQFPLAHLGATPFDPTEQPQATFLALGKGDGTFGNATQIASRGGYISVGDINGDGVADLLLQGPDLDVFLGTGSGNVALKESYFTTFTPFIPHALIADFNGDGKADVFSSGALLFGNGDGTLKANLVNYVAATPAVEADFNQDGKTDLAAIDDNGGIHILMGDGTGRFTPGTAIPQVSATQTVVSVKALDVDGDGKTDLVVATGKDSPNAWTIYLLTGNGDGTFNAPVAVAQSSQLFVSSWGLADLNNDHKSDLIVGDSSGAINVFLGNGDGSFTASNAFFGGQTTGVTFVTGDFNNDGKVDLAVGTGTGLKYLPGKGDGTFGTAVSATSLIFGATVVADFNGDGNLDLCEGNVVVLGNGDGTFRAGSTIANTVDAINYTIAADLNGDGKVDLVGSSSGFSPGQQALQYALGNGDGTFTPVVLEHSLSGIAFQGPVVADVNGDGRPDILFSYISGIVSLLNGQVPAAPDFSETATTPSSSTVSAGQSATFGFNVAPMAGFQQTVSFTCSGAPANSTCTVSPTSVMVSGSTPTPIKVTVATTSGSSLMPASFHTSPSEPQMPVAPVLITALLAMLVAMTTMVASSKGKRAPIRLRWATVGSALVLVAGSLLLTSCGGGGSMQTTPQPSSGTATGSYTIKVTGTSGSGTSAVSHAVSFTLVVQ